jgi:hypothetical protein
VKKCRIKSWYCETKDKEIFAQITESLKNIPKDKIIRQNKNRTVYRIKVNGKYYFIKLIHPKLFRHKLRELFLFTKSYSEYKSALFLEKVGLEVVKVIGWGKRRWKNFLVTEDAGLHIENARDFWLKTAKDNPFIRKEFLNSLSYFLRKCIYANFKHPDFHLGNVLLKVTKEDLKFIFVDPDGIKFKTQKLNLIKLGVAELIIGFIMKELTREESLKLLIDSNIVNNEEEFDRVWLDLRKFNVKWVKSLWKKRRKRVLSKNSRFSVRKKDVEGNRWYLKKDNLEKILLKDDILDINKLSSKYKAETLSFKNAEQKWLLSYYMQFQNIPHVKVIAFYISQNKQESVLLYETYTKDCSVKVNYKEIDMLKKLCETANVSVKSYDDCIVYKRNRPVVIEYSCSKKL